MRINEEFIDSVSRDELVSSTKIAEKPYDALIILIPEGNIILPATVKRIIKTFKSFSFVDEICQLPVEYEHPAIHIQAPDREYTYKVFWREEEFVALTIRGNMTKIRSVI